MRVGLILLFGLVSVACHGVEPVGSSRGALGATDPGAERPLELDALDSTSRAALARSPVPVLLLPSPYASASTLTSGRGFYAISAREGELAIALHATDIVHAPGDGVPLPARDHEVRGRPALVLVNEGVRSVTWEEGRVSYVLELECYHPFEDPRCTEDDFVLSLAEALVPVEAGR